MAYNQFDSNHGYEVSAPGFAERTARGLRKFGHALTVIPLVGDLMAPALTGVATILESGSSVSDGQYSRGFKQAVSGTMDTAVTTLTAGLGLLTGTWWLNSASALFSGSTLSEHARQMTNWGLDAADDMTGRHARAAEDVRLTQIARMNQVLSAQPRTNGVAMAGIGYAPAVQEQLQQAAPTNTQFADRVAQERGQTPQEARASFMRDGDNREHVAALAASREHSQTAEHTV